MQKLKTWSQLRILIIYVETCDVNCKNLFGNYIVFFSLFVPTDSKPL